VIHRDAIVHPIVFADIHHSGEPVTPFQNPKVTNVRRFGQTSRARSIYK
jgi:hypothetical protein